MKIRFSFILLIMSLLCAFRSVAQPKATVQHYSTEDGLSHVVINSMMKDKQGFMWFGSWDGINRFDGHQFVSYKSFPGDHSPVKSDRADEIVEADADHLWVRQYDRQIYRFSKADGNLFPLASVFTPAERQRFRFVKITRAKNNMLWLQTLNDGLIFFPNIQQLSVYYQFQHGKKGNERYLPSNNIDFFRQDADGRIWVGTADGLACLVPNGAGSYRYNARLSVEGEGFTAAAEAGHLLCFSTEKGDVYVFNKSTQSFTKRKVSDSGFNSLIFSKKSNLIYLADDAGDLFAGDRTKLDFAKEAQVGDKLRSLYEDRKGNIWIEPETSGVLRYDPQTSKIKWYHQEIDEKFRISGNHFKIFEDNRNRVWVSMRGGGFGYYDSKTDNIPYFLDNPNDPNRKFSNSIFALFYDKTGVLWLTTDEKGLEKIVFQENSFNQQILESPGKYRSDNEVRGLTEDRKHRLWVGTKAGKLYMIQNGKKLQHFFVNEPPGGVGQVYNIRQDAQGSVWMGTKSDGLFKADPVDVVETRYKLTQFTEGAPSGSHINSSEVYCTLTDGLGRVWVGTYEHGINVMIPEQGTYRIIQDAELIKGINPANFQKIRKLAMDQRGRIWAATTEGLMIIDATENLEKVRVKTYSKISGNSASLGNNDVQFVMKDSRGRMWMATSGGGLCMAIGDDPIQSLTFKNYTTKNGLANGYLFSLAEDNKGNIWLASQNGLTKFNPGTGQFRNYTTMDGIPRTVFSEASCVHTSADSLVFGSINGLVSVAPSQVSDHFIKANLAFTDVRVNNQPISGSGSPVALSGDLNHTDAIDLRYNQNVISFDYAVLDYRSADKQIYEYRLKGFDTTWHNNDDQLRATYTNLPPGRYTFEVKCTSVGLYSNVPYKSIGIHILPPPWLSWWAYLIYLVIAIAIFIAIRRTVLTMLNLRHKIAVEQELAALKLKFFTNVSHELRTPLTLIVNPIAAIADAEPLSPKGKEYITLVQKNTDRMVRFINQLLDLRKVQSGKATLTLNNVEVVGFIKNVGQYFNDIAQEKGISIQIHSPVKAIICRLDEEKMETVIYNILGNAFKFSPANKSIHVRIDANTVEGWLTIAIQDEAGGLPDAQLNDVFELYYEGHTHNESKGTGIGLSLAKELVELHGGKISAQNNAMGGLTVIISVKLDMPAVVDMPEEKPVLITQEAEQIDEPVYNDFENAGQVLPLILLVEDNLDLSAFLKSELSNQYRIALAENGLIGLQLAEELMPDLILSDVMMPEMDGIQMLDKLKNNDATSHIPVILLSARQSVESQIEGLRYGADYYITKPFNNKFLFATIHNLIAQRKHIFEQMLAGKRRADLGPSDIEITTHDEVFLQKVIKVVEEGMADPKFMIGELVDAMNMSRTAFYNKFKSLTDLAPVEFIREMRLKRAKQYFDAGETNISDVGYLVGFDNIKYFSSCFKEYYKKSPKEYLKDTRNQVNQGTF